MKINKNILNYIKILLVVFLITYIPVLFYYEDFRLFEFKSIVSLIFFSIMLIVNIIFAFNTNYSENNIFEIYKCSKIYILDKLLFIIVEFDFLLSCYFIYKVNHSDIFQALISFIIANLSYLSIRNILGKENGFNSWIERKIQLMKLKDYLDEKTENLNLKIVLFEDFNNMISEYFSNDSFDNKVEKNIENIIYLSTNDILKLKEYYKEKEMEYNTKFIEEHSYIEDKLKDYIYVYLNTVSEKQDYNKCVYEFKNKYEKKYNNLKITEVLVFEKLKQYKKPENLEYIEFFKLYNKNNYIAEIKDLLMENDFEQKASKEQYKILESFYSGDGYNLYKNAYMEISPYTEILILFNYMIYNMQVIAYYTYVQISNEEKINVDILSDNYNQLGKLILKNVNNNDGLAKNIRKKIDIPNNLQKLLLEKIEILLDIEFEKTKPNINLSFAGLCDLLTLIRNKIQSHGSINENNVEIILYLVRELCCYFNYFLNIENLKITNEDRNVFVSFDNEQFVYLKNYVIYYDNSINVVQRKSKTGNKYRYTNYFIGKHVRPQDVEID